MTFRPSTPIMSAHEARNMALGHIDEHLGKLNELILVAINKNKTSIRVPYDMCIVDAYSAKFKHPDVQKTLIELGYNVIVKSEDLQFVDVWIEVSW